MKTLIAALMLACLLIGLGCAALSEVVTPATIDSRAVRYAAEAGVADANDYGGYPNLLKATKLEHAVEAAFQVKTLSLQQMADKNRLDYDILKGVVAQNAALSRQREQVLFGEKGLLSMGLGLLGVGGLGTVIGLMRKRPGDWTQTEVDSALAELKVETGEQRRQFAEVVQGVQKFLELHPKTDTVGAELRAFLQAQSLDTRQAVAVAKTS